MLISVNFFIFNYLLICFTFKKGGIFSFHIICMSILLINVHEIQKLRNRFRLEQISLNTNTKLVFKGIFKVRTWFYGYM